MTRTALLFVGLFVVLILIQAICSKMLLLGYITPIVFIYLILRLPVNLNQNWVLLIAFGMGLVVDMFNNTQGLNALACTLLAAARRSIFNLYVPRDDDNEMGNPLPAIDTIGPGNYLKYMSTLVVIYCTLVFLLQAFSLHNIGSTLLRIAGSSALSIVLLFGFDLLASTHREKRL